MAKFILLDTETTGTDENDHICQLAFIVLEGKKSEVYNSFCKPSLPISFGAMAIHNITNEMVETAPEYQHCEAAIALEALNTPENTLIIQNAPFDLGMLKKEGFEWRGKVIDTLRVIHHLEPDLESHGLQYLRYAKDFYKEEDQICKSMNLELKAHDALSDVVVLRQLMSYLITKVDRNIDTMVTLTQKPILYKSMRFGKHKNKPLEEVAKTDPGYLTWALKNMNTLDEDMRYSLNFYLGN
jgi:DNA polymerase III epsilon subunit-like protein